MDTGVAEAARKLAVDSIAFINAKESADALIALAAEGSPVREQADLVAAQPQRGRMVFDGAQTGPSGKRYHLEKEVKLQAITVPEKPKELKFSVKDVLALKGDAAKGKQLAGRCVMCHQIDGQGAEYGPALKGFGQRQPAEIVARSIVDPSFDISHGFDGHAIQLKNGDWIDGLILAEGDTVKIRSTGGVTQDVPKGMIKSRKADGSLTHAQRRPARSQRTGRGRHCRVDEDLLRIRNADFSPQM